MLSLCTSSSPGPSCLPVCRLSSILHTELSLTVLCYPASGISLVAPVPVCYTCKTGYIDMQHTHFSHTLSVFILDV